MSTLDDMLDLAAAARGRAYAPYSGFRVGAVLRAASGALYAGCNVENAAYPQGTCAEAGAIAALVMAGELQVLEVLVLGPTGGPPCTPCGGCRQRLREFCADDTPVHVADADGVRLTTTMAALLPHHFGAEHLR